MKRFWRKFLVFAAVAAGVLVVLMLVASWLVPVERVKEMAVQQVAEATGAEITLADASVRFLPRLAVSLRTGSIKGTGAALAQRTGTANDLESFELVIESLDVRVALGPLLKREVEVDGLVVAGPLLRLVGADGTFQAEDYRLEVSHLVMPVAAAADRTDGGAAVEIQAPGERIPADLALDFTLTAGVLLWDAGRYDEVRARGEFYDRVLDVAEIRADCGGGLITGACEADYEMDPHGVLDFEARFTAVPAASLLGPWVPGLGRKLEGLLDGQVSGSCELQDAAAVRSTLDLTGDLKAGDGVLHAGEWLEDVSSYLGERQDLKEIRFRGLEHACRVSEGRYLVEDLHIDGLDTDWTGDGWVGLDGAIDLDLRVKLPAGFTPDLGSWSWLADTLRDDAGRVNLDLHLSGRAARPRVGVDLGKLMGGNGEPEAGTLKKGLGSLLDKVKTR